MLFRTSPEEFWNLIASRYAASPIADMTAYRTKIENIKPYLSAESVVLDIGCGTGTQCLDLAGNVKQVTGVDISQKLLTIAEQRTAERQVDNVNFVKTSVFDTRFQPGSFDMVMAFYVLHFFEDIEAVFKRIHSLLKPGGLFIFETACLGEGSKIGGGIIRLAGTVGLLPKMSLLTNTQIALALEKTGFNVVDKVKFKGKKGEYTYFTKKT